MADKYQFWKSDWLYGLIISIAFLFIGGGSWINGLERFAYDAGVRASSRAAGERISIIAIDDQSIANLGRWPWPRDKLATIIDRLAEGGAKVIGSTVLLSEAQIDPGLEDLGEIIAFYEQKGFTSSTNPDLQELGQRLQTAHNNLNTDARLAASMENASNVVMGMQVNLSASRVVPGKPDKPLPDFVRRNIIRNIQGTDKDGSPWPAETVIPPLAMLGDQTTAIGHLFNERNPDGSIRSELLAIDYYGEFYPSLALMIAARGLNLGADDIQLELGQAVRLGKLTILTDPVARMYPLFYQQGNNYSAFPVDSFFDVYAGKVPVEKYKDRIVLIGATAFGVGTSFATPVSDNMSPVMLLAHTVASILNQDFFVIPEWAELGRFLAFVLISLFLILLLPRLSAGIAALASIGLLLALIGTSQYLLIKQAQWIELMWPSALLVCGYLLLITKRFLVTERGMKRSEEKSAESNRMLGIQFQQQGQLDMALEKFRQCPLDDSMMEPLYNLALDYERKRQFNKAASIYQLMATHDAKFRDINERIKRSNAMQETFVFGAASGKAGTLVLDVDGVQKPMLGRYQVEKELGKGAMGIVYQGRDPKINRVVAIKTLALSEEFEAAELEAVKERFFREAETAGRLTHPNIVTIYDAGEELDLAYIAMEFLKGHDLNKYITRDNLFAVAKALEIIATAADALNYAHSQNVVHRDIKPANIMYDPDADKIKITDFGIARITDSSKTKTGMILGTPAYMSPEQISGKKVDGRSDLFSLSVMCYQLLCGALPFEGDSMTALMYSIANEPHPDIFELHPELPPCVVAIINKGLQKNPDERFQSGEEMATHFRNCIKTIS